MTQRNKLSSSRRRLLKALGGAGSAACVSLLSNGWKKPVVNAVTLPAHASTTGLCQIQLLWDVTVASTALVEGGYGWTLYDSNFQIIDAADNDANGSFNDSDSIELAPGTYYISFGAGFGIGSGALTIALRAQCCGPDFVADGAAGSIPGSFGIGVRVIIGPDGSCDIDPWLIP